MNDVGSLKDMWKYYFQGAPKGTPLYDADDLNVVETHFPYNLAHESKDGFQWVKAPTKNPAPSQKQIENELAMIDWVAMLPRWEREVVAKMDPQELKQYFTDRKKKQLKENS